jgi:hypothetical protein
MITISFLYPYQKALSLPKQMEVLKPRPRILEMVMGAHAGTTGVAKGGKRKGEREKVENRNRGWLSQQHHLL